METIADLENWMIEKKINNTFTPNHRYVTDEGEGLEELSGIYIWYSNERGNRTNLEFFKSEKGAVSFVYEYLNKKI